MNAKLVVAGGAPREGQKNVAQIQRRGLTGPGVQTVVRDPRRKHMTGFRSRMRNLPVPADQRMKRFGLTVKIADFRLHRVGMVGDQIEEL